MISNSGNSRRNSGHRIGLESGHWHLVWHTDRSQQGQVLVLGTILAGAIAFAFMHYFDAGMTLAEKARQDHALDAASYSGALAQARSLNMLAYIHRTQAAHQVAMAHLVTLGSLIHFAGAEAGRAAMANPPAHVIGMHFGPQHMAAYMTSLKAAGFQHLASEGGLLASAYSRHDYLTRSVLASAAAQVAAGLAETRNQAIHEVLKANFPKESTFELEVSEGDRDRFLAAQPGNPLLRPFLRDLTELYRFLEPRNHTARSLLPVSARCPTRRHELRRRGSTLLGEDGLWQAMDTQSYHALRSNRWIGCYYREYPMGWGWIPPEASNPVDVEYIDDPPENFAEQDFWRWVRDSTNWDISVSGGNPLANSWAYRDRQQWTGGGLPEFHAVSSAQQPSAHFTVSLRRAGRGGLMLHSQSAAEAYFRRPESRLDGRKEAANTFHPYWQARLRPRTHVE